MTEDLKITDEIIINQLEIDLMVYGNSFIQVTYDESNNIKFRRIPPEEIIGDMIYRV